MVKHVTNLQDICFYNVGPPNAISWFINTSNCSYLRTMNHRYWSYKPTWPSWGPHIVIDGHGMNRRCLFWWLNRPKVSLDWYELLWNIDLQWVPMYLPVIQHGLLQTKTLIYTLCSQLETFISMISNDQLSCLIAARYSYSEVAQRTMPPCHTLFLGLSRAWPWRRFKRCEKKLEPL